MKKVYIAVIFFALGLVAGYFSFGKKYSPVSVSNSTAQAGRVKTSAVSDNGKLICFQWIEENGKFSLVNSPFGCKSDGHGGFVAI